MKVKVESWKVERLIKLHADEVLYPEHEYQRGARWSADQARLFIDSVLRGYQIPMIYFRKKQKGDDHFGGAILEIIDGQQRINALAGFNNGRLHRPGQLDMSFKPLYDPRARDENDSCNGDIVGDFPASLAEKDCPWAGKKFADFSEEMKQGFLKTEIPVAIIDDSSEGGVETCDLFIRLQGGVALKPQEIRDSWPGDFCSLVREIGGMILNNQPGHGFFRQLTKKSSTDRGDTRLLVAQLLMLLLRKHEEGKNGDYFIGLTSSNLDTYYRRYVGLSSDCPVVKNLKSTLDELLALFKGENVAFHRHDVLHMILFVDMLREDAGASALKSGLVRAFKEFSAQLLTVKEIKNLTGQEEESTRQIWEYQRLTSKSATADNIRRRHEIYERHMRRFLGGVAVKGSR